MTTTPFAGLVSAGEHAVLLGGPLGAVEILPGDATGGRLAVVEHVLAPHALGAPMHTHTREDEYTLVQEGLVGVQVGDEVIEAGPGDVVVKPRGIPHAVWNPTDRPARLLEIIMPGAFAAYFGDLAALMGAGAPDLAAVVELAGRYGVQLDAASVPGLVERYGLHAEF